MKPPVLRGTAKSLLSLELDDCMGSISNSVALPFPLKDLSAMLKFFVKVCADLKQELQFW